MAKRLSAKQKVLLIKKVLSGEKISVVSKETGVSRTIFYRWIHIYKKNLTLENLHPKKHWRKLSPEIERKVFKTALQYPFYNAEEIAKLNNVSTGYVAILLKKHNLGKSQLRSSHKNTIGMRLFRTTIFEDKLRFIEKFERGEKVSNICKEYHISRTVFYKWLNRYKNAKEENRLQSLESLRRKGETHWKFINGAPESILTVIHKHPEYDARKIALEIYRKNGKQIISASGIYYFLKKYQLNTYQKRLTYLKSQTNGISQKQQMPEVRVVGKVNYPLAQNISPSPKTIGSYILLSFILFIFSFLLGFFILFSLNSFYHDQNLLVFAILNLHKLSFVYKFTIHE